MDNAAIQTRLRSAGLRATRPRIVILQKLGAATSPLSVDEIFRSLSRSPIDRVTIYRTLEHFIRVRLVRAVDLKRDAKLYELQDEHDHHHLVCVDCGTTEDFTGCNIETIAQKALKKSSHFAAISDHSLELFGRCNACTSA